jgi:hypothetical protein
VFDRNIRRVFASTQSGTTMVGRLFLMEVAPAECLRVDRGWIILGAGVTGVIEV